MKPGGYFADYASGTGTDPTAVPVKCRWCEWTTPFEQLGSHCGSKHPKVRKALLKEFSRLNGRIESLMGITGRIPDGGSDLTVNYTAQPSFRYEKQTA